VTYITFDLIARAGIR